MAILVDFPEPATLGGQTQKTHRLAVETEMFLYTSPPLYTIGVRVDKTVHCRGKACNWSGFLENALPQQTRHLITLSFLRAL